MAKAMVKNNPMLQDELKELQNRVAGIAQVDVQVGRVLDVIVSHLARLNNLDYPVVDQEDVPVEQSDAPIEQVDFPAQVPNQEGNN